MATGQISRRRHLVAADLAGEHAEVLRESEGEEASAAVEEEVFGLEEDPWPPDRTLGAVVSLQQILPEKMHKCFRRVKEKKPPPPQKRKCLVWSLLVASLSLAQPLKHSHRRQKLSPSKEDPWTPDRSLSVVVLLHQISRRSRLVAADLAGENAEVLRESEGEEAFAAAEEVVFVYWSLLSLSCSTSQTLSSAAKTLTIEGGSIATGQISRPRRLIAADLARENAEVLRESEGEEASTAAEDEVFGLEGVEATDVEGTRLSMKAAVNKASPQYEIADLAGENAEVLRESEGEEASVAAEEEVFGLELSEGNLLLYYV
ncbi:uncharacterized protein G2W53_017945 [Senna tora]|uniref:Uncharacterized protein n=1 Tax=Senna tora TaxID=362788 RepID=A0A834TTQ4_9FABA|nr:uncharacterized protein G2W53_017945 [Senna tora]